MLNFNKTLCVIAFMLCSICPVFGQQEIDPRTLIPSPPRQKLTEGQTKRIKTLQKTFREVDSAPLAKWLDNFRRDQNPERELRVYETMAKAYRSYCVGKSLSLEAKSDVFQVVLMRSMYPENQVLSKLRLKTLSREDVKKVLNGYKSPAAPIEVRKGN